MNGGLRLIVVHEKGLQWRNYKEKWGKEAAIWHALLDRHFHLNVGMRLVTFEGKVVECK